MFVETKITTDLSYTITYFTLFFLLLLTAALLYFFYSLNRRKSFILCDSNHDTELQLLKAREEFLVSSLKNQQIQKQKIALELHDHMGVLLSTIKIYMKSIDDESLTIRNREIFLKMNSLVDQSCEEVRRLAHRISVDKMDEMHLVKALEKLRNDINETGLVEVRFIVHGSMNSLSFELEVVTYRIIQELTNNALKHGRAKKINIQLIVDDNEISLSVDDDGEGFNMDNINYGIGLKGIEFRIKEFGGDMIIQSSVGMGALIVVNLPLNK